MKRCFLYDSSSDCGYRNLATEEWFLTHVGSEDLICHFYQNRSHVIIGKNQNPWLECDLAAMERDGVGLVRRVSGGGAVYHDGGNLNFSFIAGEKREEDNYLDLILEALAALGIPATFSGRNDIVVEGKKVSGNAFAVRKGKRLHHGTLLISSDLERLQRYLTVSPQKIASKGIDSVRSRVANLSDFAAVTAEDLKGAIAAAMEKRWGYWADWQFSPAEEKEIEALTETYASDQWNLGHSPKFDLEWEKRFSWGGVRICLSFEKGRVVAVKAYSDAMDPTLCQEIEACLLGVEAGALSIADALSRSEKAELIELSQAGILA